jgi:hypothetical protein
LIVLVIAIARKYALIIVRSHMAGELMVVVVMIARNSVDGVRSHNERS